MNNWTDLYQQWNTPLKRLALRYLNDVQLAEDIVQDIFLRLLEKKLSPSFMDHPGKYLKTAVYHQCMSYFRQKKLHDSINQSIHYHITVTNNTEELVLFRELQQLHLQSLKALPPKQKEVYILCHLEGLNRRETASLLQKSSQTVKLQYRLSRESIRKALNLLRA